MAKAQFHKNQRVFVKPVGTWSTIERVVPQWTKGLDEPLKISYDVGLGREFAADELQSDAGLALSAAALPEEAWRILRARNRWQQAEECAHHPEPGTYPVVVTGERDWGGWRVPGAEYDLTPERIERQARLIAAVPRLVALLEALCDIAAKSPENTSNELAALAADARNVLKHANPDAA